MRRLLIAVLFLVGSEVTADTKYLAFFPYNAFGFASAGEFDLTKIEAFRNGLEMPWSYFTVEVQSVNFTCNDPAFQPADGRVHILFTAESKLGPNGELPGEYVSEIARYVQDPSSVLKQTVNNPAQADYFVWGWPGAEGGTPTFGKFWLTMMPGNYFEPRTSGSGGPCDAADIEIQFLFGFGLNDTLYNFYAETATITHNIFWDSDGDGFTNPYEEALGSDATNPASTPSDFDGDGVTNAEDAFPNDASETLDTDGDGVGDNADAFPNDPSNWAPTIGPGVLWFITRGIQVEEEE